MVKQICTNEDKSFPEMKLILPFEFLPGKRVGELPSERRQLRDRGSIVFRSTPGSYTIKLGFFYY